MDQGKLQEIIDRVEQLEAAIHLAVYGSASGHSIRTLSRPYWREKEPRALAIRATELIRSCNELNIISMALFQDK